MHQGDLEGMEAARLVAGRAIAEGANARDVLLAIAAGELGDVGRVDVPLREALAAARDVQEEERIAHMSVVYAGLRDLETVVLADLERLKERTAGKATLNVNDFNQARHIAATLAKVTKALPRTGREPRRADPEGSPPVVVPEPASGASALAERIANRSHEAEQVTAAGGNGHG